MSVRKSLTNIVLVGALALGIGGCSTQDTYHYNGKIGEEQVRFYEENLGRYNTLEVSRADGTVVEYSDRNDDLKLDYIDITRDGETTRYEPDVIGQKVMEEAQLQFDKYLEKIHEIKQTKGLSDISKE